MQQASAAIAIGALLLIGAAMVIASRAPRLRGRIALPLVGPLSEMTTALIGICCLAGAQQVAAHAYGMDPKLPPLVAAPILVIVIVGSIAMDAMDAPGNDS